MKKENENLNHKVFVLTKERDELFSTLTSTQNDFDAYKIFCKAKFLLIDKDEISMLKNKINSLGEVLKKCEFDKSRLEAMFPKKHTLKIQTHATHTHTHKSQHLHTHHAKHITQIKHVHTPTLSSCLHLW